MSEYLQPRKLLKSCWDFPIASLFFNSFVSLRTSRDIQNVITKAYDNAEIKSISREEYSNASQYSLSLSKMFLMDPDPLQ